MEGIEIAYDGLCEMIEQCVTPVSYEALRDRKKMLVIAISEEVRFQRSIQKIEECNPGIELLIVSQTALKKVLDGIYDGRYQVVGWNGTYTTALIDQVKAKADIGGIDGFLYYTQHPVNLRDNNFIRIAQVLRKEADIHVYSDTVGYELYEYHNLPLYSQGIRVYEEINRLIELKLSCAAEENRI